MVYRFCFGSSYFPFSSQRIPHASLYFFLNSNRSVMFQTIKEEKIKKKHDKKIIKPLIGEVVERERERGRDLGKGWQYYTHVRVLEFRTAIDSQPPFSKRTRAQSVYFLAIALCSTDSPSSSTAFGSAPANSSSCCH